MTREALASRTLTGYLWGSRDGLCGANEIAKATAQMMVGLRSRLFFKLQFLSFGHLDEQKAGRIIEEGDFPPGAAPSPTSSPRKTRACRRAAAGFHRLEAGATSKPERLSAIGPTEAEAARHRTYR